MVLNKKLDCTDIFFSSHQIFRSFPISSDLLEFTQRFIPLPYTWYPCAFADTLLVPSAPLHILAEPLFLYSFHKRIKLYFIFLVGNGSNVCWGNKTIRIQIRDIRLCLSPFLNLTPTSCGTGRKQWKLWNVVFGSWICLAYVNGHCPMATQQSCIFPDRPVHKCSAGEEQVIEKDDSHRK